jgi:hypothetical protein
MPRAIGKYSLDALYEQARPYLTRDELAIFRDIAEDYCSGRWTNIVQLERMLDKLAELYPPLLRLVPQLYEDDKHGGHRQDRSRCLGSYKLPPRIEHPANKVLIGILSCNKYYFRRQCQRETWLTQLNGGARYAYIVGGQMPEPMNIEHDVVYATDVPDDYEHLSIKTRALIRFALEGDYDYLFKTDDDVYVQPDKLLASSFADTDYTGFSGWRNLRYLFGGGYWLSRRAMELIDAEPEPDDMVEDRYIGRTLAKHLIVGREDKRYMYASTLPDNPDRFIAYAPTRDRDPLYMYQLHRRCYEVKENEIEQSQSPQSQ